VYFYSAKNNCSHCADTRVHIIPNRLNIIFIYLVLVARHY